MSDTFDQRLEARTLRVGVVGLGYVGLPLVIGYAEAGFTCVGFDVDPERVSTLSEGQSPLLDVSAERVATATRTGRFLATCDLSELGSVDVVFVCVPTPFDRAKTPDLSFVKSATHAVASVLRAGMLVIFQSTTFPGTTVEVCLPILEGSGLRVGAQFHLAFCPERVDPGNSTWTVRNTPKVVGGATPACAERARAVLEASMERPGMVRVLSSPAAAEMTKLLENIYRAVNIALVCELAVLAHEMSLDIWEVIDAAATKPFGFEPFYPGAGPGGHCIPVDPYYLSWRAREFDFQTKFIELAADTNLRMAPYIRERIQALLNRAGRSLQGTRVLALGVAFKPGVADVRNSRAVRLLELLEEAGAQVRYSDPFVSSTRFSDEVHKSVDVCDETLRDTDLVVILVANRWPIDVIMKSGVPVFDVVNATTGLSAPQLERL